MINSVLAAAIGVCLIVLFVGLLTRLAPPSGDVTIQPEGEPDPGVAGTNGRPTFQA